MITVSIVNSGSDGGIIHDWLNDNAGRDHDDWRFDFTYDGFNIMMFKEEVAAAFILRFGGRVIKDYVERR